jgi:hypothetical protein
LGKKEKEEKKMRVAILLYGQARFLDNELPYLSHKLYLLDKYPHCDVFCHVWFSPEEKSYTPATWSTLTHVPVDPLTIEKISQIWKPVSLVSEPSLVFWPEREEGKEEERMREIMEYKEDSLRCKLNLTPEQKSMLRSRYDNRNLQAVFSHMYSLQQVSQQCSDYMLENSFEYDFIVKSRYDLHLTSFPDLRCLSPADFYLMNHHSNFPDLCFIFGPSFLPCFQAFDHLDSLVDRALQLNPQQLSAEGLLRARFEQVKSPESLHPIGTLQGFFVRKSHKTAVLICGQYRSFDKTLDNLLETFIYPNSADVFLVLTGQTEVTDECVAVKRLTQMGLLKNILCLSDEDILSSKEFQDALHRIGSFASFMNPSVLKGEMVDPVSYYQRTGRQFYAIFRGGTLLRDYEEKNGFRYDYVIKVRTDMYYSEKYDIKDIFFDSPFISKTVVDDFILQQIEGIKLQGISTKRFQSLMRFVFGSRKHEMHQYISMFRNNELHFDGEVDSDRLDGSGRLQTFLRAHFSSQLFGGAYYQNTRMLKAINVDGFLEKERSQVEFYHLVNDHVISCPRVLFDHLANFINVIGNTKDHDKTAFFWTPEYALMEHLDKRALSVMLIHGAKVV